MDFFRSFPKDTQELILLLNIMSGCTEISSLLCKGSHQHHQSTGSANSSGDDQKSLDILANEIMIRCISHIKVCAAIISEELEEPMIAELPPSKIRPKYVVAIDPLDGSSNIECNVGVGTIFAIWKLTDEMRRKSELTKEDILMPANQIVCSGYCIYGTATEMVLCFSEPGTESLPILKRYIFDPSDREFKVIDHNMRIPIPKKQKRIYSINEGNHATWDDKTTEGIARIKASSPPYSLRYVGSMVSDVHRTLLYGGIFLYPADKKTGKGKLRLLYEAFPMAMIMEAANGHAITGPDGQRILDIVPVEIHQKCSVVLGGKRDVDLFCGAVGSTA